MPCLDPGFLKSHRGRYHLCQCRDRRLSLQPKASQNCTFIFHLLLSFPRFPHQKNKLIGRDELGAAMVPNNWTNGTFSRMCLDLEQPKCVLSLLHQQTHADHVESETNFLWRHQSPQGASFAHWDRASSSWVQVSSFSTIWTASQHCQCGWGATGCRESPGDTEIKDKWIDCLQDNCMQETRKE